MDHSVQVPLVHMLQKELVGDFAQYTSRDAVIYTSIDLDGLPLWLVESK